MAALAMFCAGSVLQATLATSKRAGFENDALLLLGAIGFALGYFVLNTVMVTMVPRLKRNEPLRLRSFIGSFGWLGIAYAGNASVATFLYLSFRQSGIVVPSGVTSRASRTTRPSRLVALPCFSPHTDAGR